MLVEFKLNRFCYTTTTTCDFTVADFTVGDFTVGDFTVGDLPWKGTIPL